MLSREEEVSQKVLFCTYMYFKWPVYTLQVHSDFVGAATRGAMAVIDGNVMAINPGEEAK